MCGALLGLASAIMVLLRLAPAQGLQEATLGCTALTSTPRCTNHAALSLAAPTAPLCPPLHQPRCRNAPRMELLLHTAPEVLMRGEEAGTKADVFALGTLLWEVRRKLQSGTEGCLHESPHDAAGVASQPCAPGALLFGPTGWLVAQTPLTAVLTISHTADVQRQAGVPASAPGGAAAGAPRAPLAAAAAGQLPSRLPGAVCRCVPDLHCSAMLRWWLGL